MIYNNIIEINQIFLQDSWVPTQTFDSVLTLELRDLPLTFTKKSFAKLWTRTARMLHMLPSLGTAAPPIPTRPNRRSPPRATRSRHWSGRSRGRLDIRRPTAPVGGSWNMPSGRQSPSSPSALWCCGCSKTVERNWNGTHAREHTWDEFQSDRMCRLSFIFF